MMFQGMRSILAERKKYCNPEDCIQAASGFTSIHNIANIAIIP